MARLDEQELIEISVKAGFKQGFKAGYTTGYEKGKSSQNPVLDKIRAEIDGAKLPKNRMSFFRDGINCALQIIDKYKAESEDK